MARKVDAARVQEELVAAVKQGDEVRARELVSQLGAEPQQVRAALEAMLEAPLGLVRQAAAFGLGQLGGKASARRLEQQLVIEEARGDYDGEAVIEDITRAMGRIKEASARASLLRRMERLVANKPGRSDMNEVAYALWRKRHPDLSASVRASLEKLSLPAPHGLHGLLVLLEKSPDELDTWARALPVPLEHKTQVLLVLEEEIPDPLIRALPAFISTAEALLEPAIGEDGEAAYYCERLFSLLLSHREQVLPRLSGETRATLRALARGLVAALSPNCSIRAVVLLKSVGRPEDAEVITAHRPSDSVGAKVFDDAARVLRELREK